MSAETLGTYLNDHLAGSVVAVEMVERAIEDNPDTGFAELMSELVRGIREDQAVLRSLLERLGVAENPLKKAGAWLLEKAGRLKLGDTGETALRRVEMLEALGLGIQGKAGLWRALQQVSPAHPELAGLDLLTLERRALEQFEQVEAERLKAAVEAF